MPKGQKNIWSFEDGVDSSNVLSSVPELGDSSQPELIIAQPTLPTSVQGDPRTEPPP
jgi:hypothetical protein